MIKWNVAVGCDLFAKFLRLNSVLVDLGELITRISIFLKLYNVYLCLKAIVFSINYHMPVTWSRIFLMFIQLQSKMISFYTFLMIAFNPSKLADLLTGIRNLLNRLIIAITTYPCHVSRGRVINIKSPRGKGKNYPNSKILISS